MHIMAVLPYIFTGAVFFLPLSHDVSLGFLFLSAFLWSLRVAWTGRVVIRRTAFDLPLLGFVVLSALSITQAPQWFESYYNWANLFGRYLLVYFLAVHCLRPGRHYSWILGALLAAAVLVSVYGIFQYMTGVDTSAQRWVDSEHFPWLKTRAFSTLGNPNILAGFLVMCIGLAAGAFLESGKLMVRSLAAVTVPIMLACIVATFSRGAWVALGVMGLAAAALRGRRARIWCAALLLAAMLVLAFVQGDAIDRLRSIGNPADSSANLRLLLWESTWNMIVERPWLGWGWASYSIICLDYNVYVREENITMYHAHNTLLHYASEIGIPGMLFFAWASILMMVRLFRLRSSSSPDARMFATAVLICLAGLWGFCMTDHLLYNIRMSMIFWLFLGLTGRMDEQTGHRYWVQKKIIGLAGFFHR